jgi:hypothetical protein
MKAFAFVLLALDFGVSAALAADIYAKYFADADGGRVCYARNYDAPPGGASATDGAAHHGRV